jgi:DNA-binding NtrC family response regulator
VSPRVLVIDDEPTIRAILGRALEMFGYEALEAASADSAYKVLEEHAVDAVLLDLRLQELPGEALYYTLVRRWTYLAGRIIFMSGDLDHALASWSEELLRCPRLAKPFHLHEMVEVVDRVATPAAPRKRSNGG